MQNANIIYFLQILLLKNLSPKCVRQYDAAITILQVKIFGKPPGQGTWRIQ